MGNGFKGHLSYLETGKGKAQSRAERVAWMEFRNLPTRDLQVAACMMRATADLSVSGTRTPLYTFSVSCAPDDPVDERMLRGIAARIIRDLELEEYEVVIVAHRDRSHLHLHFAVNRVHPERGTLWSNWRDCYRIERSLRAQERELGLTVVPGWLEPVRARDVAGPGVAVPDPDARVLPRSRVKRRGGTFIEDVQARAVPVLESARSWSEAERGLAERGLSLVVKGGGFRITDGSRDVKASEVGREFSRFHLEKRFGPYPDYRARMAVADAPRPAEPWPAPEPRRAAIAPEPSEVRPERREELAFPAASPPAPVDPPSRPAPELASRTPVESVRGAPEPGGVDPPRPPRSRPVAPAPPPPPSAPDLPDWLRDLALHGAALEEAERRLEEAATAVHEAEHALAMIPQRTRSTEAAAESAALRIREVYADPEAATKEIRAFRRQRGSPALLAALRADPEQFGALREERQPWMFGIFYRSDTRKARSTAPLLAIALDHYYATAARAPSQEERAAAQQRVTDAHDALHIARRARRELPPAHSTEYRRELAQLFTSAAAEVPGGAERLARLLTTTLPRTARFVAGALNACDEARRRELGRGGLRMDL
jgi:hypothetical protein